MLVVEGSPVDSIDNQQSFDAAGAGPHEDTLPSGGHGDYGDAAKPGRDPVTPPAIPLVHRRPDTRGRLAAKHRAGFLHFHGNNRDLFEAQGAVVRQDLLKFSNDLRAGQHQGRLSHPASSITLAGAR